VEMTKELNKMLRIETNSIHRQMNRPNE